MFKDKKLFLLDMDGTIYLDDRLFDGCMDLLCRIKDIGGRYLFLTNNSSKSVDDYVYKLNRIGIPAVYDDFLTSSQATARYLREKYGSSQKLYVLGTSSLKAELAKSGLHVVDTLQEGICCLVMGFDTELSFSKLEDACKLLGDRNIDYIATNPDLVCPTSYGYVPDCGSVSQILKNATGRTPVFIGKPAPEMVLLALDKSGFDKSQAIIIGDRIYTDIACGVNAGISSALVLSGETTLEDVKNSPIKPGGIYQDIKEILDLI